MSGTGKIFLPTKQLDGCGSRGLTPRPDARTSTNSRKLTGSGSSGYVLDSAPRPDVTAARPLPLPMSGVIGMVARAELARDDLPLALQPGASASGKMPLPSLAPKPPRPEEAIQNGALHMAGRNGTSKGGKIEIFADFEQPQHPVTVNQVLEHFFDYFHVEPTKPIYASSVKDFLAAVKDKGQWLAVVNTLEKGVVIVDHNLNMVAIRTREALPLGRPQVDSQGRFVPESVVFGRMQSWREVDTCILESNNPQHRDGLQRILDELDNPTGQKNIFNGWAKVGDEFERINASAETGHLTTEQSEELLEGQIEDARAPASTLAKVAGFIAEARLRAEKLYTGLIAETGTPPSGRPETTNYNIRPKLDRPEIAPTFEKHGDLNVLGHYIIATVTRYMRFRPKYQPCSEEGRDLRLAQAKEVAGSEPDTLKYVDKLTGAVNLQGFLDDYGHRLWVTFAGHMSIDIGNFLNDKGYFRGSMELATNMANLSASLGGIIQLFMASGPYCQGHVVKYQGVPTLDARSRLRNEMGTAPAIKNPIEGAWGYVTNVIKSMTQGAWGADRLARAAFVEETIVEHGNVRVRAESGAPPKEPIPNKKQGHNAASARIEYTGGGASEAIMRLRSHAALKVVLYIATQVTVGGKTGRAALDAIAKKYLGSSASWQDIFVDVKAIEEEFVRHRFEGSAKAQAFVGMWETILDQITAPGMQESVAVMRAGIAAIKNSTGTFDDLAQGHTTLGHAMADLATRGYNGLQALHVVHAFLSQQAKFLSQADYPTRDAAIRGKAGFNFEWPDVSRYSDEAIRSRSKESIGGFPEGV